MKIIAAAMGVATLLLTVLPVAAQNTIIPDAINEYDSTFWGSDVFATHVPGFVLGHQWGAARLDKVNTALKMNVTGDNWGYLNANAHKMYTLGDGLRDTNYIVWASPLWFTPGRTGDAFRIPWYGFRWEPAENSGLSSTWQPRDGDSWPFSFGARHHGSVPTSASDVNYRRFVLDTAGLTGTPVRVLDSAEPRNLFRIYSGLDWSNPLEEHFYRDSLPRYNNPTDTVGWEYSYATDWTVPSDSVPRTTGDENDIAGWYYLYDHDLTDGRRMQLVINLRRTSAQDTILDDAPVLSVVVPYHMRWKDQNMLNSSFRPGPQRMPFRKIPMGSKDSCFSLPLGRGSEMPMQTIDVTNEYCDSLVITRAMLPLHSDSGGPDVTIVAEFRTDTIIEIKSGVYARRPHFLKTSVFDYPAASISDSVLQANDKPAYNRRYQAIDSLGVTVWYHGNAGVAIHSVSLVTPWTKRATSGYHDTAFVSRFRTHRDSIKRQIDTVSAHTGRTIRLLSFYTNDEFDVEQLLGMRYKLEFLDRRLTAETGYNGGRFYSDNLRSAYGKQKLQGFPTKFLWTAGPTMPTRPTIAPYLARGGVDEWAFDSNSPVPAPILSLKAGYRWNGAPSPFRTFETDVSSNYYDPSYERFSLPVPSAPHDYTSQGAYETYIHSDNALTGTAIIAENTAFTQYYGTGGWYFAKRRNFWCNFFYHLDPVYGFDSHGRPYVRYNKFRPLTGEEVRLQHGAALNLGTRGFMYDKFYYQDNLLRGDTTYRVPPPEQVNDSSNYGHTIFHGDYFPGCVTEDTTAFIMDTLADSVVSADSLLRSEHLGGDYFTTTDRISIHPWTPLDTLASQMQLSRCMHGQLSEKVYAGRLSVRMETKWWHDLVTDTTTRFKHEQQGPSNAEIFMLTRPVGWFGKGYKTLSGGDLGRLRLWVDAYDDSVKVAYWSRASAQDTTLVVMSEGSPEQLYDVVLMDISASDTAKSDDTCVIAVTNRRTSPFLFNTTLPDSIEWISSYEHDTLSRGSRPDLRYKQVGARRITLPFNYTVDATKPYLLHVRELVPKSDSSYRIDTILNWNSDLTAWYRPGQTRFFLVRCLPATDTLGSGYLAFNTQNKMVVYPVRRVGGSGYGDSVRYHMVFHRRDTDPLRSGPWTVYYQRSKPYHKDSLHLITGLQWEQPIRLSKVTTASTPSTDGLSRTRYSGVDSAAYEAAVDDTAGAQRDCCCGFPSIVVREIAPDTPKVFVVYACEDMWAPPAVRDGYLHIAENAFLDVAELNPLALEVNGKSLAIAPKDIGHDIPADNVPPIEDYLADTLGSLGKYGTPVVNASAENRMYYAWSGSDIGIGCGTKLATEDYFAAPTSLLTIPMPTIPWYYDHDGTTDTIDIAGGDALYPSLNVYSNLAQGQTSATLVWEEGQANRHIRYTRLVPGIGGAIARSLPSFVGMSFAPEGPPTMATDVQQALAVVGGAMPGEEATLPVVVRSLQADTMSMFIRDSSGNPNGLYRYNHETVGWQEYLTAEQRERVRYQHFVDMTGLGPNELHYWWVNTTQNTGGSSVFHPVLTQGVVRRDSITWQGVVDDSLITYADSLHIVSGNISDSALVVNYSYLGSTDYAGLHAMRQAGHAAYWTGLGYFNTIEGQQIYIRRLPPLPAPPQTIYHYDYLRSAGAWPHLSMRPSEQVPFLESDISGIRRIMQYTDTDAPALLASAEQFYRLGDDSRHASHATFAGIEADGQAVTLRLVLGLSRGAANLRFMPIYDQSIPRGFAGSGDYARQMAAMSMPVSELLSEPFVVEGHLAIKVLSCGPLRGGITLTAEEVNPQTIGIRSDGSYYYTNVDEPQQHVTINLAKADATKRQKLRRAGYTLTAGNGKIYRLRLKYTGGGNCVYREDVDVHPQEETFEREATASYHIINLRSGKTIEASEHEGLLVFPNPSSDHVTIMVTTTTNASAGKPTQMYLQVTSVLGAHVLDKSVTAGDVVDLTNLPAGTYLARLTCYDRQGATQLSATSFTVVQ